MAKRNNTNSKAGVTPKAPVSDSPPAEETNPAPIEETTPGPAAEETDPAGATPEGDAPPTGDAPTEEDEAPKTKGKKPTDLRTFVLDLLKKRLPSDTAEAWVEKVTNAIENNRIVVIAEVDGANVLEVHKDLLYSDRNSVRTLAAKYGRSYKVNVNQMVLDKFKG